MLVFRFGKSSSKPVQAKSSSPACFLNASEEPSGEDTRWHRHQYHITHNSSPTTFSPQHIQNFSVNMSVCSDDSSVAQPIFASIVISYHATGFAYHQESCGNVPGIQPRFPEAVEVSGGGVVKSSAAEPSRRIGMPIRKKEEKWSMQLSGLELTL